MTNPLPVGNTFIYPLALRTRAQSSGRGHRDGYAADRHHAGGPAAGGLRGHDDVTCSLGTIASGATPTTVDLTVSVGAAAANTAPTNTATVASATPDPDPTDNSSSATVGVGNVANLSLAKNVSPQTANVGDTVTFTYTVTNGSPSGETGGAPAGLGTTGALSPTRFRRGSSSYRPAPARWQADRDVQPRSGGGKSAESGEDGLVRRSDPAWVRRDGDHEHCQRRQRRRPANGVPVALPDLDPSDNTDAAAVVVNPQADLSLTKTVSDANPGTDDEVDYTLTAHNAGPNDATGVTIHDSLPAGLTSSTPPRDATTRTARSSAISARSRLATARR